MDKPIISPKMEKLLETHKRAEINFKKSETQKNITQALVDNANINIEKIDCLERLLSSIKPGDKEIPLDDSTNWVSSISQPWQIKEIEKKILEIVSKM